VFYVIFQPNSVISGVQFLQLEELTVPGSEPATFRYHKSKNLWCISDNIPTQKHKVETYDVCMCVIGVTCHFQQSFSHFIMAGACWEAKPQDF